MPRAGGTGAHTVVRILPAPPSACNTPPTRPAGSPKAASAFVRNTKGLMRTVGSFMILGSSRNTCCSGDKTGRWCHVLAHRGTQSAHQQQASQPPLCSPGCQSMRMAQWQQAASRACTHKGHAEEDEAAGRDEVERGDRVQLDAAPLRVGTLQGTVGTRVSCGLGWPELQHGHPQRPCCCGRRHCGW